MNGHAKHWVLIHQQNDLTHVLRRPVEMAANNGRPKIKKTAQ
jgi:hypothetical protein